MGEIGVESAPESVDLNELLGITDEGIDAMNVDVVAEAAEEEEEINEPHITIATKKLLDVLKISAMISAAGENSFEGKSVVFKVEQNFVRFLLSDNKRNIEKYVEIINKENKFEGFLAFSTSFLARVIRACGSTFSIIERTETENDKEVKKYVLKITGGDIFMDNIKMSEEKFIKDFSDSSIKDYNKESVMSSISRLFTFASTAIKTGKNLDFVGKVIQATPINSIAKITHDYDFPTFRLSLTDSKVLYSLMATDDAETLGINKDGKIFKGNTYTFKTESYNTSTCVFDTVAERMFNGEYAVVDVKHLSQITDLSVGLDTSIGKMRFNYTPEGRVECELLTKRKNSKIQLQGSSNSDLVVLETPVEVPSANLKGALTVFSQETTLTMRVTPDGVALESGNIRVAVLGSGVGK